MLQPPEPGIVFQSMPGCLLWEAQELSPESAA